ncbi:hypothetical protein HYALB_00003612 [Hymenoscyphus albidus]|uniref:Uncharacterized protein n=1 Tax=Hymenoscyphus albidus TaxID=595503 RepID=A0A9N9M1A0_9HELO|nr:hypothetical protein HYALB_00003612 [Hymenoscyphus albidus]
MAAMELPLALIILFAVVARGTRFEMILACGIGLLYSRNVVGEVFQTLTRFLNVPMIVLSFVILQLIRYVITLSVSTSSNGDHPAKAMFFPCKTSHIRLYPKKNSFEYSYLMVGIPIGWKGTAGGLLSADVEKSQSSWYLRLFSLGPGTSWWSVDGDNYLARGSGSLKAKLEGYLKSEGIDPQNYPYACLFTAAECLGHSSNPVSFWHLYSPIKELAAVIYEVNNTFDERHMYFLEPQPGTVENPKPNIINQTNKSPRVHGKIPKEFFVSPFNFRNERYSMSLYDPFFPSMTGTGPLNHAIALTSRHGRPKLAARIWSTAPGIDPSELSLWQKTVFIWSWWWVGLMTLPRTVIQAYKLKFCRKLDYSLQPEPRLNSIGRQADAFETFMERIFFVFLTNLVARLSIPVKITCAPVGIKDTQERILYSPPAQRIFSEYQGKRSNIKDLSIQILTPKFYSRLIFYAFSPIRDILRDESQLLNQTLQLSDTEVFETIFDSKTQGRFCNPIETMEQFRFERTAVFILALLTGNATRNPAPLIENWERGPNNPPCPDMKKTMTSNKLTPDSFLEFFMSNAATEERKEFYIQALKARIAPYIAFGSLLVLDIEVWTFRSLSVWFSVSTLFRYIGLF